MKSLVPPSANTFHSFAVESKEAFDQISTKLAEISAQVKSGAEQFQALKHYPPQERDDIVWLGHELEYNAARDCGFFQAVQDEEFKERYLKLVTGLDEESVETVNRIITWLQICITCAEGIVPLKIFNPVEKEYFLFLQNEFFPSILKISDDCYAYKQYRLPINHFEPCVFLDKHGLAKVERKIEEFEDKDIVDAGGFIGDSVLILSPLTKRNVYTFEPISDNYNLMLHTMEMNGIENAVCEKKGIGFKTGDLDVQYRRVM